MREGIKRGGSGRKSKRDKGLSAKRPSPSSRIEQGQGGSTGRPTGRGARRRPSARRRPEGGAKRRGGRGSLIPVLTLGWGCLWRRLRSEDWAVVEASGGGAIGGGGGAREGCGGSVLR
jgi:hypothetical protein